MKTIRLRPGKERSLLRRHPWIFESAIARGGADAGETVRVESDAGEFLAWAAFSPASKIRARVWSFDPAQRIDASFFIASVSASIRARARFDINSDACRRQNLMLLDINPVSASTKRRLVRRPGRPPHLQAICPPCVSRRCGLHVSNGLVKCPRAIGKLA